MIEALQPDKEKKGDIRAAISAIAEMVGELGEAKAMLVIGQPTQASYMLETGVEKYPANCDLWHAMGHAHRQQGRNDEAIEAYTKAIDIAYRYHAPIHFECSAQFTLRAVLHFEMGEHEKAKADLEAAIFQDHENHVAQNLKMNGYTRGMQVQEYTHDLMTETAWHFETSRKHTEIGELQPYQQQHDKAIYFYRHGLMKEAVATLSMLLKQQPNYPMAWHHRAEMYLVMNERRQAYADINRAIEESHLWHEGYHYNAALHHLHRGLVYAQTGQPEMAMMDFSKALDLHKHFTEVYVERAKIRASMEQYPSALADIEHALSAEHHPEWELLRMEWMKKMGM